MKAKTYAITVQFGGGFHLFRGYEDTESAALEFAKRIDAIGQASYNSRTGRRGVRPRVMVWKQVPLPPAAFSPEAAKELDGLEALNSQQVDNIAVDLGGKPDVILQRLPLGALEGDE